MRAFFRPGYCRYLEDIKESYPHGTSVYCVFPIPCLTLLCIARSGIALTLQGKGLLLPCSALPCGVRWGAVLCGVRFFLGEVAPTPPSITIPYLAMHCLTLLCLTLPCSAMPYLALLCTAHTPMLCDAMHCDSIAVAMRSNATAMLSEYKAKQCTAMHCTAMLSAGWLAFAIRLGFGCGFDFAGGAGRARAGGSKLSPVEGVDNNTSDMLLCQ